MPGRPRGELSEKHWKALKLLEQGLERKDVAAQCGWGPDYFAELCAGDIEKVGYTADLFKKELQKITAKGEEETKTLIKENIKVAQRLVKRTLIELEAKKKPTEAEKKLIVSLNNTLNKSTPSVSIGSLSYSYTQGLKPEELIYEFTRLRAIAEGSFDRRGVQDSQSGGSGDLSTVDEPGD